MDCVVLEGIYFGPGETDSVPIIRPIVSIEDVVIRVDEDDAVIISK